MMRKALDFLLGDLYRYAEAPTAIMLVDNYEELEFGVRVYGQQLWGGRTGVNIADLEPAPEEDWEAWENTAWARDEINRRMGHGEAA